MLLVIRPIHHEEIPPLKVETPIEWTILSAKEHKCLVDNVYYEARGETPDGQRLVARTTLNRAKTSNVCTEVYKYKQFSWTLQPQKRPNPITWAQVAKNVEFTIPGDHYYFHNTSVSPKWARFYVLLEKEGNHVFYSRTQI